MAALAAGSPALAPAATYYVRQTVGDDSRDGLTPGSAWQHLTRLGGVMQAGDTAYVGPGLYREQIDVQNDGKAEARITFVADTTGQHTGDPPGVVMLAGSEPVDESIFTPGGAPGVYRARMRYAVYGVVEMDGSQLRYRRADDTAAHLVDRLPEAEVVARTPSTYHFDEKSGELLLHTSDGQAPTSHELELMRRAAGISMTGRHYVTIMGFTFRSMQDAGINFFKGTSHGIAVGNTSWGSRQGIRVYGASNMLIQGNTLFRNENSGAYFAAASTSAVAIGNVAYENTKGLRWSSASHDPLILDNHCLENIETGIALENVGRAQLRRNVLAGNHVSQLLVIQSEYAAEHDCFARDAPTQLTADFRPFPQNGTYATLADYQAARQQDLHATEGDCGPRPAKVDVHRLHAEATAYVDRARRIMRGDVLPEAKPARSWLDRLLGR